MADKRMDDGHRNILTKNTMTFKKDMVSVSDVIGYLEEDDVITESMKEEILAKTPGGEQNVALHSLIPKRGQKAFDLYYLALRKTKNRHLADILEPCLCDQSLKQMVSESATIPSHPTSLGGPIEQETGSKSVISSPTDEECSELPSVWPDVNASPLAVEVKKCDKNNKEMMKNFNNISLVYCMKSKSARVVIINNKKFEKAMDTNEDLSIRDGTDIDATCLDMLFKKLGYSNVKTETELKGKEILDFLREEARTVKVSCEGFFCFILSHGNVESVYGTDGAPVPLEEIYSQFDGDKCPHLIGKPKLFFIQACKGNKKDGGSGDTAASGKGVQPSSDVDVDKITKDLEEKLKLPKEQSDATGIAPTKADILVASATTPGFVSWRNTDHGSWFIQAFVEVMKNHSFKDELQHILTKIAHLGLIGGSDTKETVWRILATHRLIHNSLAKRINWSGVHGKRSIKGLTLEKVVGQ